MLLNDNKVSTYRDLLIPGRGFLISTALVDRLIRADGVAA